MLVELPNLAASPLIALKACASVRSPEQGLAEWLSAKRQEVVKYTKDRKTHFIRLVTGGAKTNHFHLEAALKTVFAQQGHPSPTLDQKELQKLISRVDGCSLDLVVSATFRLPLVDLPEAGPIRLLSRETDVAGTAVKLVSGVFQVKGSGIDEVAWRVAEEQVSLTLKSRYEDIVSPTYFIDAKITMENYFKVLILNKKETDLL